MSKHRLLKMLLVKCIHFDCSTTTCNYSLIACSNFNCEKQKKPTFSKVDLGNGSCMTMYVPNSLDPDQADRINVYLTITVKTVSKDFRQMTIARMPFFHVKA